jgi:hypothetical protein
MFDRNMAKFVEVCEGGYDREEKSLREVLINPNYVAAVVPCTHTETQLQEGRLPEGLNPAQKFSRIILADGRTQHVVVGDVAAVELRLRLRLLRG